MVEGFAWLKQQIIGKPSLPYGTIPRHFNSFQMCWLTWQAYQRFYDMVGYSWDYDSCLMDVAYMALNRISLVCFEIIEYHVGQSPETVWHVITYSIRSHWPDWAADIDLISLQHEQHIILLRRYRDEWNTFVDDMIPIIEEGDYVSIKEYMYWYRRVSKVRIAPLTAEHPAKIVPRD